MIFLEEVPSVMEEAEALEKFSTYLEETFFEARERFKGKGKGKGKKGKGYSKSYTFGKSPSFGVGRGGYIAHRKMLQATRNARGFDRPWQKGGGGGNRVSLSELKGRTRCHQCKQIGHWSRECPQRAKSMPSSPTRGVNEACDR